MGFDAKLIKERQRRLAAPGIARKLLQVFGAQSHEPAPDVEAALYEGFLHDEDKRRCATFASELDAGRWQDLDYADKRLSDLAQRLKARSFGHLLSPAEQQEWHEFVSQKLQQPDAPWLSLAAFHARLDTLLSEADELEAGADKARRLELLLALKRHGENLVKRYGLAGGVPGSP